MELSRVKGIGPSKIEALQAAGITTAQDLAQIDLRKGLDVDGVSRDALKSYKQRARQLLQREGIAFEKAPYATDQPTKHKPAKPTKAASPPGAIAPAEEPASVKTRGFISRLFGKP